MGLDGVELVLEIEDRFGISIPDEDGESIRTVGDLCDYLLTRARTFLGCPCPTASAFYRIRHVFTDHLGIERSSVRPNTPLASLLPKETRFQDWQRLSDHLGAAVPPLRWSLMIRLALDCFCLAAVGLPIIATIALPHLATFFLSIMGAIVLLVIGFRLARPMAAVIPEGAATVGMLSRTLVKRVYLPTERDPAELDPWIFNQVCEIVVDVLGVDRSSLTRDSRFVEDLGIG